MVPSRSLYGVVALLWLSCVAPRAKAAEAMDFGVTAQSLAQMLGCKGLAKSLNVSMEAYDRYCRQLRPHAARYLRRYQNDIQPVLAQVVPEHAGRPLIYPFGGGDLLTALGTFPNATDITTLSLETSGDVRAVSGVANEAVEAALMQTGDNLRRLLSAEHSRTTNLSNMAKGLLPAEIAFSLFALNFWGFEVQAFRYFDLDQEGQVVYFSPSDIQARDQKIAARHLVGSARAQLFPHVEIQFRRANETQPRVFRHLAGNLADVSLKKDDRVLRHLRQRGKIFAMTKAASYLLWWDGFGLIRDYLAKAASFMISDSTGLPPHIAREHGFSLTTFGAFAGPFLPGANAKIAADFKQQWAAQPMRPIRFHYGYPDVLGRGHMLVIRREANTP